MALSEKQIDYSNQNLDVLRNLYVISYVVGFRELLNGMPWPWSSLNVIPSLLVATVLTLLAMRMFWAVRNIRHFVSKISKISHWSANVAGSVIMLFHVPILMSHSFVYYLLCKSYTSMFTVSGDLAAEYDIEPFFYTYIRSAGRKFALAHGMR